MFFLQRSFNKFVARTKLLIWCEHISFIDLICIDSMQATEMARDKTDRFLQMPNGKPNRNVHKLENQHKQET